MAKTAWSIAEQSAAAGNIKQVERLAGRVATKAAKTQEKIQGRDREQVSILVPQLRLLVDEMSEYLTDLERNHMPRKAGS